MPQLELLRLDGGYVELSGNEADMQLPSSLTELIVDALQDGPAISNVSDLLAHPRSMTRLESLCLSPVAEVPASVGLLPCLKELCVHVQNSGNDGDPLAALAGLTTLRELTLTAEFKNPVPLLPYLPGLTRLEVCSKGWDASNVAASAPNLAHLRISFADFEDDVGPLAPLTSLTCIRFDADADPDTLPRNLHALRHLRHVCLHGCDDDLESAVKSACTTVDSVCMLPCCRKGDSCPLSPTRYHRCYD